MGTERIYSLGLPTASIFPKKNQSQRALRMVGFFGRPPDTA